jgi:hypothetical protein|tara:strand:+ start:857 stop:1147 length:291 start_codon:yes stop_codon:yes gene_type:complete
VSLDVDREVAYGVSRAILRQALRDFHSTNKERRIDVAKWINHSEYKIICESAEIDPDFFAMFFAEMSKRPLVERKVLAENAISLLDSFPMNEPPTH